MASVQEQLKLKRAPSDIWSVKEQLCLASSVLKSGDQNWMSVSRSLKTMIGEDSSRPADWFSQKSCAQQYDYLLEKTDIPKRQKRESGETTSELIVRRLTEDRIAELTKTIADQKEEYLKLKSEVEALRNEKAANEKYKQMWLAIQEEEKQKSLAKEESRTASPNHCQLKKELPKNSASPIQTTRVVTGQQILVNKLTSPKTTPVASKPDNISNVVENRPSSSAPTLSMLLQQPSVSSEKILQKLETSPLKSLPGCSKTQSSPETKPTRVSQDSETPPTEELVSDTFEVLASDQDLQASKEKVDEIKSDPVKNIQESVTDSKLENLLSRNESKDELSKQSSMNISFDHSDEKIDDSSFSTSAGGDISMEEIDSCSSKIAEIIGTSIENIEPDLDTTESMEDVEKSLESKIDSLENKTTESSTVSKESSGCSLKELEAPATISSPKQKSDEAAENTQANEKSIVDISKQDKTKDQSESTGRESKEKLLKESTSDTKKLDEKKKSSSGKTVEKPVKDMETVSETTKSGKDKAEISEGKQKLKNPLAVSKSKHEESSSKKVENITSELQCEKSDDNSANKDVVSDIDSSDSSKKLNTNIEIMDSIKIEPEDSKTSDDNTDVSESDKCVGKSVKKELVKEEEKVKEEFKSDEVVIKQENIESEENSIQSDKEEPSMVKFSGNQVVKTYSKKQNAKLDTELENDSGEETADYRAWKKSVLMLHNRLATHKYGSIFLRPITEDQAPGYHSIVFKPMDLSKIKKNIDNGTIRSTAHFQREIMLMFQNAIMFNKQTTQVYKMTVEMQEDFLQQLEVLHKATAESSFRRETRTAASFSSEIMDSGVKRRWSHNTSNLQTSETPRMKKLRKSKNDS